MKSIVGGRVERWAIRLADGRYIESFSYPRDTTHIDKAWEKSPGIRIALCLKAIPGKKPKLWADHSKDAAEHVAEGVRHYGGKVGRGAKVVDMLRKRTA